MDPIVWAVFLLCVGLALAVLELFLPSGGLIGLMSLAALAGSVWMGFSYGAWTGLGLIGIVVLAVPGLLGLAIRIWPRTPMGRRLLLDVPTGDEVLPDNDLRRSLKNLVGKRGVAKTLMMPSGAVEVGDQVIDAVSEGVAIEPGHVVKIVEVRGSRVVVRPTDDVISPIEAGDPLSRPIESLGLDPFNEPLLDNPSGSRDDSRDD
ncbi:MAG TPA: NfeD family protein [Pirellulales bacterium]|nr:NfeD family protein [Pirellulales bacterium]